MKRISTLGWCYLVFGLASCGYFCAAAISGWPGPDFNSGGNSYSGGSSYGRSYGGFWGGGK